jgi:ParB-like chromosome segregation protein Spo0J
MNELLSTERKQACLRVRPNTAFMRISDIKIGPRFRKELGDIDALAKSIEKVGLLHPVVVSEDGELIAGLRRLRACERLGWSEIPVHVVDPSKPRDAEVEENLKRKDFSVSEMAAIADALEPEVKADAKARQGTRTDLGKQPAGNFPVGRARDIVGSYAGVSGKTLEKARRIVKAAEREPKKFGRLLEKTDAGQVSINAAYKKIVNGQPKEKKENNAQPLSSEPEPLVVIEQQDLSSEELRDFRRIASFRPRPVSLKTLFLDILHWYHRSIKGVKTREG